MGLAGDDELHRALRIGQQAQQPLRVVQQQVRSLVGREAARKAQRQGVGIKEMLRLVHRLGRRAGGGQLPGQSLAGVFDKRLAGGGAKLPEPGVGDAANVLLQSVPSSPASGPFHRLPSTDHRPPPSPRSAYGLRWSRVRPGLRPPASAERAAAKRCRLTFPCKRLTPLTAPLPRIAR